jgi:hypothetical protein
MSNNYSSKSVSRRGLDSVHTVSNTGRWVNWCIKKCHLHEYSSDWRICGDGFPWWSALLLLNTTVCNPVMYTTHHWCHLILCCYFQTALIVHTGGKKYYVSVILLKRRESCMIAISLMIQIIKLHCNIYYVFEQLVSHCQQPLKFLISVSFCALLLHHMPLHYSLLAPCCCQYWINFSSHGMRYFTHFSCTDPNDASTSEWDRLSNFSATVFFLL